MGHGSVKILSSIIDDLLPGDILYVVNSQEPLIVALVTKEVVILSTADVLPAYRVVREIGERIEEFPINWDGFEYSDKFEIDLSPFNEEDFEDGMVVLVVSEDKTLVKVETLVGIDLTDEVYITKVGPNIPYSWNDRIIPTGVKVDQLEWFETEDE